MSTFAYATKPGPVSPLIEHVCDLINDKLTLGRVNAAKENQWNSTATIITWTCDIRGATVSAQVRAYDRPDDIRRHYGRDVTVDSIASRVKIDLAQRVGEAIIGV